MPARIPLLDEEDTLQPLPDGGPGPVPFVGAPAGALSMEDGDAAPSGQLSYIGDETPLGRFAQPILPAAPEPTMPQAETPGMANRGRQRAFYEGDLQELGRPHMGQPGSSHPGWGGKILHGLAETGNIAGEILDPGAMERIRGTDLNNNARRARDMRGLSELDKEDQDEAKTNSELETSLENRQQIAPDAASKRELEGATTKHLDAETTEIPADSSSKRAVESSEVDKNEAAAHAPGKEVAPMQQAFDGYLRQGLTPMQAYEKIREKPGGVSNVGTWQLAEDKDGKPILFNSKTGGTRDSGGIQKAGSQEKKDAAAAPVEAAITYAKDYLDNGHFTGPGDEALQEKFFELAKPSTGFRMSQPQIDMLANSRGWMNSWAAHLRHMTSGTWFSPEQRQQIVDTMTELHDAKLEAAKGAGGGAQPGATPGAGKPDYVYVPGKGLVKQ